MEPTIVLEVAKYALEPNPIKLQGQENYLSWARHARLILSSHGFERLLVPNESDAKGEMDAQTKQSMIECLCSYWVVWNL